MRIILYFLILVLATSNGFANFDGYKKISKIEMNVVRNGKIIGHSNYFFKHKDKLMTVRNETKFNVKLMGIEIFSIASEAIEKYDNGNLFFFESNTLQNGKKKFVNLYLNKNTNKFKIKGSSYTGEASNDCVVGNWWNTKILSASKQISPLSGSIKEQVVSYVGEENLIINGTAYIAKHFTLKSKNEDLPKDKKLNFNIWLSKENNLIMKVTYSRMGDWEYNLKKFE